jgi:hypothetical protein
VVSVKFLTTFIGAGRYGLFIKKSTPLPNILPLNDSHQTAKIQVYRTAFNTPAATDTSYSAKIIDEILKLVHQPLPPPLFARSPGIMAGTVQGEQRKHTGVPVAHPAAAVVNSLVGNIKTVTGGAKVTAGRAAEALLG